MDRERPPGIEVLERAEESLVHIKRIRSMLTSEDKATDIDGAHHEQPQATAR